MGTSELMRKKLVNYFVLFHSTLFAQIGGLNMECVVHLIVPCITSDMSALLLRPFTRADLEVVLFNMPPPKLQELMACLHFSIRVIGVLLVTLSVLLACAY